jgi:hypothetical protein
MNSRTSAGSTVVDGGFCQHFSPLRHVGKKNREKTETKVYCPLDKF